MTKRRLIARIAEARAKVAIYGARYRIMDDELRSDLNNYDISKYVEASQIRLQFDNWKKLLNEYHFKLKNWSNRDER